MNSVSAEQTQDYIDGIYVTRDVIAERAGVSEERIMELAAQQCIPPEAYEVKTESVFGSAFGEYRLAHETRHYFHPSHVEWIRRAQSLSETLPLAEVAKKVKNDFLRDVENRLGDHPLPWPAGIEHVWKCMMDGSWSLCLKDIDAAGVVHKELARRHFAELQMKSPTGLTDEERVALEQSVKNYLGVALPFSPHEYSESSRCRELAPAIQKFGLEAVAAEATA